MKRSTDSGSNKSRRSHPHLPCDVLESILRRLPLKDLVRAKALSSYWNFFAESPWLMIPNYEQGSCRFINMFKNLAWSLHRTTSDVFLDGCPCIIGTSHGWLIFLDTITFTPFLLNPFTGVRIDQLPSLKLFGIRNIEKRKKQVSDIKKAILSEEPVGSYSLVLLICWENVVYYGNDNTSWTILNDADQGGITYLDIICHENKLYVLHKTSSIYTWEARERIVAAFPSQSIKRKADLAGFSHSWPLRYYVVESGGKILLVLRFFSEGMEFIHGHDYRIYTTRLLQVFKLDLEENKWVKVNCLGDRSLFVGTNQSISIPTKNLVSCKGNSIYFTEDCTNYIVRRGDLIYLADLPWRLPYEWGHDNGIYSLEDGSCSPVYNFNLEEFTPSPWWIVPTSCKLNA